MKSTSIVLTAVLSVAIPAAAQAQSTAPAPSAETARSTAPAAAPAGPSSVTPASASVSTSVAQVLKAKDDVHVVLEGTIVRKTRHERYEFRDASGTMTVEIDDDKWPDGKPMLEQRVRLYGETEKKFLTRRIEVDVDRIEPLK